MMPTGLTPRYLAIGVAWGIAVVSTAVMVQLSAVVEAGSGTGSETNPFTSTLAILIVLTASVGWLLVARRPGNRVGSFLAVGATLVAWAFIGYGVAASRYPTHGQDDPIGGLATVLGQSLLVPAFFLTFAAPTILFPDGRLPDARWRWPFRAAVVAITVGAALSVGSPSSTAGLPDNPLALPLPWWVGELAGGVSGAALILSLGMAALAILVRYRRSIGIERAQVKWLAASLGLAALFFPLSWATDLGPDDGGVIDVLSVATMALVPLSILVAILRYRLYDIDRLISRTVSWALVSGSLLAIFATMVIGLQTVLDGVTQGGTVAVALSTLVVAALFQPVRRRVQLAVDRRFDRARYDGERTAEAFAQRLSSEVDLETLAAELRATASATVRPSTATIWLAERHAPRHQA